jgi:choline dehydrogenase-like flavoprotein
MRKRDSGASRQKAAAAVILDGRSCPAGTVLEGDLCIIGGGPAGITVAHELASTGLKLILVESGGTRRQQAADALNAGVEVSEGFAPLSLFRRRVLGGASVIWGGRCVPFDPIDFEPREHVPLSGWPVSYEEVAAYYPRALAYCEAGAGACNDEPADVAPFLDGFSSDSVETSTYERFSAPTNFGKRYGPALKAAADVVVLTHTTCTQLLSDDDGRIVEASCVTLDDTQLRIKANRFVLAAGSIETYRLLANSPGPSGAALGDHSGMLGRCLMNHMEGTLGRLVLDRPDRKISWGFERSGDGVYCRRRITIAPAAQREHKTLNFVARLHHELVADPRHHNGILSAMFLVKRMLLPEYRGKLSIIDDPATVPKGAIFWSLHARNILMGVPALAGFSAQWFWRRHLIYRRLPYVVLESRKGVYPLDINVEESPNPDSHLYLTDQRDRFGMRQVGVKWAPLARDYDSIVANCRILRDAFAASGTGSYQFDERTVHDAVRKFRPIGGHHIGVTRMSREPSEGVVDENCRVHGTLNLFVASASVFPTSGHASPTLTIVALSVRLAEHLKSAARSS